MKPQASQLTYKNDFRNSFFLPSAREALADIHDQEIVPFHDSEVVYQCDKVWPKEFEDYTDVIFVSILSKTVQIDSRQSHEYFYSWTWHLSDLWSPIWIPVWTNNFDLSDSLQEESVTGVQFRPCAHYANSQLHRLSCCFTDHCSHVIWSWGKSSVTVIS